MSAASSWFRASKQASTAQIGQLREQAARLIQDRSQPITSAAAEATSPVRRALDVLLPLLADYVGPVTQAVRKAKDRSATAAQALTPDRKAFSTVGRLVPVRLLILLAATLGLGYLAYRVAAHGRTTAPMAGKRPGSRLRAG